MAVGGDIRNLKELDSIGVVGVDVDRVGPGRKRLSLLMYRSILRCVRDAVNFLIDHVLLAMPVHIDEKRILFIRLDAIGDFVLWLDAGREFIRHAREQGQTAILLGDSMLAGWAAQLGLFDEVLAFDRKAFLNNPLYRISLVGRVRRLGCATANSSGSVTCSRYRGYHDPSMWGPQQGLALRAIRPTRRHGSKH